MKRRHFIIAGLLSAFAATRLSARQRQPAIDKSLLFGGITQEGRTIKTLPRNADAVKAGEWKIHILGSRCGTVGEGANHTSLVIQKPDGTPMLFDAGEYAGWTATMMGLNLEDVKNIFISHPHNDHTAGLPGIFGIITENFIVKGKRKRSGENPVVNVYSPDEAMVRAAHTIQRASDRGRRSIDITHTIIDNGKIFEDSDVSIEAVENNHMRHYGPKLSYSFRLKFKDGRTAIFSGDIKKIEDIDAWLKEGCDLLIVETGHNRSEVICKALVEKYNNVKDLLFMHHGTWILKDPLGQKQASEKIWGAPIVFADNATTVVFKNK